MLSNECLNSLELADCLHNLNQDHIFQQFPDLKCDSRIFHQLTQIDVSASLERFKKGASSVPIHNTVSPIDSFNWADATEETQRNYCDIGWSSIAAGQVAAVIMSGGQGTRLGYNGPKGMYSIGLPSGKSIFQLHMERIAKVRKLCCKENDKMPSVPVYIMTSDLNHTTICEYFERENYFNYPKEDIFFFEQGLELCISLENKIIIESSNSLAMAPDGNGGIYTALRSSGALDDMVARGVQHLHIYGIDNVLTRSLDPGFLGYCISQGVQCGNNAVWRASKSERVGVSAMSEAGRMLVVEYTELPPLLAEAAHESTGKLLFGAANICNHYLSLSFVRDIVLPNLLETYHVVKKKIPHWDAASMTTVTPQQFNGYKMELFIFDVFPLAERWAVMEVARAEQFAPVKNEPGNSQDSPDTARVMLTQQAVRWLTSAGAHVVPGEGASETSDCNVTHPQPQCEISPLLSYAGEGLDQFRGHTITLPCYLA